MKRRAGFTLTEQMVAMTAGAALMMLAVSLVHRSLLIASESRSRRHAIHNADRLADRFREDIHWATDVELVSPTEMKILRDELPSIVYVFSQRDGVRRESDSASVDHFRLDAQTDVLMSIEPLPRRAVLRASRSGRTTMQIAAVIGRLENIINSDPKSDASKLTDGGTDQ
jgi:prepilin-type N-terminal cleavage/methylation domain-containing protein